LGWRIEHFRPLDWLGSLIRLWRRLRIIIADNKIFDKDLLSSEREKNKFICFLKTANAAIYRVIGSGIRDPRNCICSFRRRQFRDNIGFKTPPSWIVTRRSRRVNRLAAEIESRACSGVKTLYPDLKSKMV